MKKPYELVEAAGAIRIYENASPLHDAAGIVAMALDRHCAMEDDDNLRILLPGEVTVAVVHIPMLATIMRRAGLEDPEDSTQAA